MVFCQTLLPQPPGLAFFRTKNLPPFFLLKIASLMAETNFTLGPTSKTNISFVQPSLIIIIIVVVVVIVSIIVSIFLSFGVMDFSQSHFEQKLLLFPLPLLSSVSSFSSSCALRPFLLLHPILPSPCPPCNLSFNPQSVSKFARRGCMKLVLCEVQNIFVEIVIFCPTCRMYLSELSNVFVKLENCICPNCQIYLSKLKTVFVQIVKCISQICISILN